jgi:hypothetical protein
MSANAFVTAYRSDWIAGYEQRQTLLRSTVTTEAVINANQAVFLVGDSGSATAVTRGSNGRIPSRDDNLAQYTATLVEKHDKVEKSGFNIFAGQGDQKRLMMETNMAVINRDIDSVIIAELATGTQDTGSAQTMSLALAMYAKTILRNNKVPADGNIFAAITPAAEAYLMQAPEFSSADYVSTKPFENAQSSFRWAGVNWIVHDGLSNLGTTSEKCYMWHRTAIGHAINTAGIVATAGYNDEDDFSYARATVYHGAKLLQNSGIVVINHDGSAFAAQ